MLLGAACHSGGGGGGAGERRAAPAGKGWAWLSKHFSFPGLITVCDCIVS